MIKLKIVICFWFFLFRFLFWYFYVFNVFIFNKKIFTFGEKILFYVCLLVFNCVLNAFMYKFRVKNHPKQNEKIVMWCTCTQNNENDFEVMCFRKKIMCFFFFFSVFVFIIFPFHFLLMQQCVASCYSPAFFFLVCVELTYCKSFKWHFALKVKSNHLWFSLQLRWTWLLLVFTLQRNLPLELCYWRWFWCVYIQQRIASINLSLLLWQISNDCFYRFVLSNEFIVGFSLIFSSRHLFFSSASGFCRNGKYTIRLNCVSSSIEY